MIGIDWFHFDNIEINYTLDGRRYRSNIVNPYHLPFTQPHVHLNTVILKKNYKQNGSIKHGDIWFNQGVIWEIFNHRLEEW